MKVCWISAGVSSFIAGYLGNADKYIYIDVADQHPDSIRFIKDCEKALGKEIEILKNNEFLNTSEVFRSRNFIVSPYGAPCTQTLKKYVRKQWERQYIKDNGIDEYFNLVYIWGFDCDEKNRAERLIKNFPDIKHEFPLIDKNLNKNAVHGFFNNNFNFKRPVMYDLGYQNNNCIGCVKGGMGYWNKIRKDFPEVFKERSILEREIGHSILKEYFLDELPLDKGNISKEIMPDCDILCYLASMESVENEKSKC